MQPILVSYRQNGSRIAIVREDTTLGPRYRLVSVFDQDGQLFFNNDQEPFPSYDELVAVCAEVATGNDQQIDVDDDGETLCPLKEGLKTLLPEQMHIPSTWLVGVGRSPTSAHDDSYESINDWYSEQGDDQFPGERQIVSLMLSAPLKSDIRLGDKLMRYNFDHGGFFFTGQSKLWTAEELLLLVFLVLSDEKSADEFKNQFSPFFVVGYRQHREILHPDDLALLALIEEGEFQLAAKTLVVVSDSEDDETVEFDSVVVGDITEAVLQASEGAAPSEEDLATGIPGARQRLGTFKAQHFPS